MTGLHKATQDEHQATLRAKSAVACLLFVSGQPMNEIERVLTQFSGGFGGAAGPIRSVSARTCDLLIVAARIAEILHPTLDLGDRISRLAIRLTYGIPGTVVDLDRVAGSDLLRGDCGRLAAAGLCEPDAIDCASDAQILDCTDQNKRKLALVRQADPASALARRGADRAGLGSLCRLTVRHPAFASRDRLTGSPCWRDGFNKIFPQRKVFR